MSSRSERLSALALQAAIAWVALRANSAGAQAAPPPSAAPAQVRALADSLLAYPSIMRTSEGDTTATSQAMMGHDGCRVVFAFEETGEDWKVIREVHADLGQLDARVDVDRETEDRDIENVEDTLPFPWRLKVHSRSGAKDVEVRRTDSRAKPPLAVTFYVDRIEFLVPSEAGEKGVSKALNAAITSCAGGAP
jgi:hypothetical protein